MTPEQCGTTHYTGCPCHEARWRDRYDDAEAAALSARAARDEMACALHELECGWWATGTVPEMMEAVRRIVRAAIGPAAPLDALAQAAQLDGQYDPPKEPT